jgi:S1-C subfamily serine protease
MRDGRVRRAYLGIAGGSRPLPPRARTQLERDRAIEVVEVVAGSPAERAGLRAEDLIVGLEGDAVRDVGDLQRLMTDDAIGRELRLEIVRNGDPRTLTAIPSELSD